MRYTNGFFPRRRTKRTGLYRPLPSVPIECLMTARPSRRSHRERNMGGGRSKKSSGHNCAFRWTTNLISLGGEVKKNRKPAGNLVLDHRSMMCVYVYVCMCIPRDLLYIYVYILNLYTYIYICVYYCIFLILEEFHFSLSHLGS